MLIIGGGMANTFLLAQGVQDRQVAGGARPCPNRARDHAAAKERRCEVLLPDDVVVAEAWRPGRRPRGRAGAGDARRSDDPGRRTQDGGALQRRDRAAARRCCGTARSAPSRSSRSVEGTFALARAAAELTKAGKLMSVAGGGDTVAALNAAGVTERFQLRLDGGRRLPRMAGRARAAGYRRPAHARS